MMGYYYIPSLDSTLPHGLYDGGNFWLPLVRISFPPVNDFKYNCILLKTSKQTKTPAILVFHILIQIKILHETSQARV